MVISLNESETRTATERRYPEDEVKARFVQEECYGWLLTRAGDFTSSQFGEDGIIAAIFEKIGIANEWCLEVGAADGLFYSNTLQWRNKEWKAILIECDDNHFEKLKLLASEKTTVIKAKIEATGPNSLDELVPAIARDMDLMIIDIDGQDWYIFKSLNLCKPRVLMVEFGTTGPLDFVPELNGPGQAGPQAIINLGFEKWYTPVAVTNVNLIFVRNDLVGALKQ